MKTPEQRVYELYHRLVYQHQDAHIYMRDVLSDIEKMVDQAVMEERERCATVNVIGKKKSTNADYQAGWFDGVEDCLDTIRSH